MALLQRKPSLWSRGLSLHWVLTVPLVLSIASATALVGCLLYPQMPLPPRPLLLLALGTIAGAIAQGLILRRFLAQLNRVSQVSRQLAAGHLSHRLPTDTTVVELSQLARAINQLADQTQQSLQGMQTALTASEQWLSQYSQISPSMIYTYVEATEGDVSERQGRFEYISAAVEEIGEVSVEAGLQDANAVRGLIHPDDAMDYLAAELESEQNLTSFSHQCRIVTPSGRMKWVHVQSQPQPRTDGTMAWHGVVVDISSYKQAEVALQESETLFRSAFDDAPIGIALIAPTGRFLRVNRYYCDLLEHSQDELLQMSFEDLIHPDDLTTDLAGLEQMNQGMIQTFQMEKRLVAKSGTVIPVFLNASCVRDADGTPLYSIRHIQDIRDRLKVERIKDEFVSIVSHELRTPITSIEGSLQLLGSGIYANRPEKANAMLDIAIKNSTRLVRLVDDILSFERLESGKVELLKEPCQVADLMRQAEDSVQSLADTAAVILIVHPLQATCHAAPDGIVQVLTNLLSNAIKFSNPGGRVVLAARVWSRKAGEQGSGGAGEQDQVRGAGYRVPGDGFQVPGDGFQVLGTQKEPSSSTQNPNSEPDTRYPIPDTQHPLPHHSTTLHSSPTSPTPPSILFSVTDHGRGIPPEKLETIFEQFQQVDVSDSRKKGGTGLGLAICKRIVQQHQGQIWVESRVGQGSTFYVALPLAREDDHA